jgi:hypothetical protein
MSNFLNLFPRIRYDINKNKYTNYDVITNITFRVSIIKNTLNNISTYFEYQISEGDTPEILAQKVYKDPEAYWVILYANDIYDPQYDWPLNYKSFTSYIASKYGSIEWAKSNYHHYEKVVERVNGEVRTITKFDINEDSLTSNSMNVPYDTYDNLAEAEYNTYNLAGKTISETITRNRVSYYDYENQLNENKRTIKIIKKEYYPGILEELKKLTGVDTAPYLRSLVSKNG